MHIIYRLLTADTRCGCGCDHQSTFVRTKVPSSPVPIIRTKSQPSASRIEVASGELPPLRMRFERAAPAFVLDRGRCRDVLYRVEETEVTSLSASYGAQGTFAPMRTKVRRSRSSRRPKIGNDPRRLQRRGATAELAARIA